MRMCGNHNHIEKPELRVVAYSYQSCSSHLTKMLVSSIWPKCSYPAQRDSFCFEWVREVWSGALLQCNLSCDGQCTWHLGVQFHFPAWCHHVGRCVIVMSGRGTRLCLVVATSGDEKWKITVLMKNGICKQAGATKQFILFSHLMIFPGGLNPAFRELTDYS